MHEVRFLQKRDRQSAILFTDLCDPDYDPAQNGNVTYEEGMKKIHAVFPDGTVVKGLAVFESVYRAVGLGWVYSFAKVPFLFRLGEKAYDFWAKKRMWLTGRPELEIVFAQRREMLEHARKAQQLEEKVCDPKYKDWRLFSLALSIFGLFRCLFNFLKKTIVDHISLTSPLP